MAAKTQSAKKAPENIPGPVRKNKFTADGAK